MKKLIHILSITCIVLIHVDAFSKSPDFDDKTKKKEGDKKEKVKRDDTTTLALNEEHLEGLEEELSDSTEMMFPSHDLYATWDTTSAHPYHFYESFKMDSVDITLVNESDHAFSMPFKGGITSEFGWRKYRPHFGTDIKLQTGDQVVTCFDGMVRLAKYYYGYGNCVIVRHNNGLETVYGHLSKILVEAGQVVDSGDLLGLGGNTGRSFGSHLHFEIRYLGQALDTEDFIDYASGELKSNCFMLRKNDVATKYDLRAVHTRHRKGSSYAKGGKVKLSPGGIYTIRQGDTLGAIARRYGTSVNALCKKNKIKATSTLRLGQKLKI
ncbi:MAG: peptidoglycan DD-metalloendopeptidase family protein [Sphingobacteriaceae bacterium]|nr:peptidoglycan DD-metalloendopeptidase family protein [Sphingobacteriaceae bacterium]